MNENDTAVRFLYATAPGRAILKVILKSRADRLAVRFLRSTWSGPYMRHYIKRHQIDLSASKEKQYRTFRDFFVRINNTDEVDSTPSHLISPCDGWLSAYDISENSSFSIKGSLYRIKDLLEDESLAEKYTGGTCLVFRLCASDYHHYCYIDDGYQGVNHYIPGLLHSVQPIACETYPVFTLNRRCWCLLSTENFGPVVQTEIGALVVGWIANAQENIRFSKGSEKGHFELAGSTIVLLFEPGRIRLLPEIENQIRESREARVMQGMWIADSTGSGLCDPVNSSS